MRLALCHNRGGVFAIQVSNHPCGGCLSSSLSSTLIFLFLFLFLFLLLVLFLFLFFFFLFFFF